MADLLLCASFFVILFIPCVLATRSARRPDLAEQSPAEASTRVLPQKGPTSAGPIFRPQLRPILVTSELKPHLLEEHAPSGDFGDLQLAYEHLKEREQQRLIELCAPANRVA